MEMPSLGTHCAREDCNMLDFLPITCPTCLLIFCKEHSDPEQHECSAKPQDLVMDKKLLDSIRLYNCSEDGCRLKDPVEMPCVVCRKHFCLSHRHHGCFDQPPSQEKRDKYRAPKEQFKKAKAATDKMIQERLKSAKNRALANKIKLMKIKSTSYGDNRIPPNDRLYFSVAPPLRDKETSQYRNLFISKTWTLGKSIEIFARKFRVPDGFDTPDEPKLRLFDVEGQPVPGLFSDSMSSLIDLGVILNGDSLILEYVPATELDNDLYNALTDANILAKYKFA